MTRFSDNTGSDGDADIDDVGGNAVMVWGWLGWWGCF